LVVRRVEVQIDELVLDGFERGDSARLAAQLPRELTQLITRRGLPDPMSPAEGGASALSDEPTPGAIARAVYEGMGRCST
jgi:hypothetical protein